MGSDGLSLGHPSATRGTSVSVLHDELAIVLEEARTAEAAAMVDLETARGELRARLQPLLAQRREMLDAQLEQARADADQSVRAAGRAASVMLAQATARAREARRIRDEEAARQAADAAARDAEMAAVVDEPVIDEPVIDEPVIADLVIDGPVIEEPVIEEPVIEVPREVVMPAVEPSTEDAMWARTTAMSLEAAVAAVAAPQHIDGMPTTNIVIDAEAFARVFATTIAALMSERQPVVVQAMPAPVVAPAPVVPAKQSFWSNARHLDVLLMGLATVIVIVVLAAWLA